MWCVPMFSNPTGTTYSWSLERATRVWTLPTPLSFPVCPVCRRDMVRGTRYAFGPWAVDAWPELTDAILTELSGR
jgi:hypothetical protein